MAKKQSKTATKTATTTTKPAATNGKTATPGIRSIVNPVDDKEFGTIYRCDIETSSGMPITFACGITKEDAVKRATEEVAYWDGVRKVRKETAQKAEAERAAKAKADADAKAKADAERQKALLAQAKGKGPGPSKTVAKPAAGKSAAPVVVMPRNKAAVTSAPATANFLNRKKALAKR
jgi:hypothetical protein